MSMKDNICPHCGYDSTTGKIVKGGLKGMAATMASIVNPVIGAAVIVKIAYDALSGIEKKIATCPNCDEDYPIGE